MIGSSLGPYKIVDRLGAGGMGEVYLAEDTRLGRKVAIKVLPVEYASDPERLARFEQEARAAAALNHPHIAVVHDIGFAEGAAPNDSKTDPDMAAGAARGTGVHYMVQEYLDGHTLRVSVERGAMPLAEALDRAAEIAAGLAAAHSAGVVHRDLKPDNIFVTKEGHAKILDFGLAKLTEAAPMTSADGQSKSPTVLGTVAGQVMGTAGYMAPEQIEASGEIDGRADLFAFGAVLYEMVTGRRAFSGKSVLDTLHAIARTEPLSIGSIDPHLPAELQRILKKAMAKEPARRYQHADELVVDLRRLREDVATGDVAPVGVPKAASVSGAAAIAASRSSRALLAALVVAALAIGMAVGWSLWGGRQDDRRLDFYLTSGDVVAAGGQALAISPDGSVVAVGGDGKVRFRRLGQSEWIDAADTSDGLVLFSSTGEQIYFARGAEVWEVGLDGTPAQLVVDTGGLFLFSAWRDGDDALMVSGVAAGTEPHTFLSRISPARGEIDELWQGPANPGNFEATYISGRLDDNRYLGAVYALDKPPQIGVVDLEAGQIGQWRQGYGSPRVLQDGRITAVDARGRLLAFELADDGESISTNATTLADGLLSVNNFSSYDVAPDGTLALVAGGVVEVEGGQQLAWFDVGGATTMVAGRGGTFQVDSRLSPDGAFLALEAPFEGKMSIWIHDIARDVTTPLSVDHPGAFPVWSPDGSEIIYHVLNAEDNPPGIYRAPVDRSAPPVMVLPDPEGEFLLPADWSPDGRTLLYMRAPNRYRNEGSDIWTIPVDDGEPVAFVASPANEIDPRFSPDGRWIAYVSNHSGRQEVYVRPAAGGGEITVSNGGGRDPEWHPELPTLFFIGPSATTDQGAVVRAADVADGTASVVRDVVDFPRAGSNLFIVGRDGERFMTAVVGADAPPAQLRVIMNPDGR